ncbi:competence protein ComEC [Tenacibaculum adriaticum]|uniref:Competence protein ComEC n=1 Tax=Tenacibaculum adriaticum TaxID=413713 RepID=A0A5S5DX85_9FLAO|nr:ComEC/Rec2 family competence protein [Tenacibaculum adriaticum]TYQ00462.1 competence protein ComEC [Tenacibaculum adriaticum]
MKKLLNYLPFHFLTCLIAGICIQHYTRIWDFNFLHSILGFIIFLVILMTFHRLAKKQLFVITSLLFFSFIGITSVFINDDTNYKSYYTNHINSNYSAVLTINKVLKPGNYYDKYEAVVSQVNSQKTSGEILLNIQKDSLINNLKVDDKLLLKPTFKELIPPLNPHQFDYKNYLAKQGIHHQVFVNNTDFKIVGQRKFSFVGLSAAFRNNIQQSLLKHNFSNNEFAVINALLLGQRQDISKDLLENYTKAGAIHILAISGLHIGILLLILSTILKPLETFKYGTIFKTILIVLLLWSFAFIAGLTASVVRAVTMFTFIAIGDSFKKKKIIEHSLITSMLVILLVKPLFLFDVGFQLSYLAVFGIIWAQPIIYQIWKPKLWLLDKFWQLTTVSLAAQAGILPISLFYFHQFPGLFLISNLVIIPFLGAILLGGILIIILALLNTLPQFLADFYGFIIQQMNNVVNWVSLQESFLFTRISMSFWLMLVWYIFIITCFHFIIQKKPKQLINLLVSILLVQSVYVYEKHHRNTKQELIVFHKSRNAIIGNRNGNQFLVYHDFDSIKIKQQKLLTSYEIGENILPKTNTKKLNIFKFKKDQILFIDSLGIYKVSKLENPIIILQYSPKINLNRLINKVQPKQIIADGTNYKSYINRWQETCLKQKTPFCYTGQDGAYIIN